MASRASARKKGQVQLPVPQRPRNQPKPKPVQQVDIGKQPFTLVLYAEKSQKGVIETRDLQPKQRIKGCDVMAPNPIDWDDLYENDKKKRFKAIVVEFGSK